MMLLPVWLPGPMFLLGVSVSGPMFLPGVSVWGSLSVGSLSRGSLSRWGLQGSLSRVVSVWRVSVQGGLCLEGLCPGGSLSGRPPWTETPVQ